MRVGDDVLTCYGSGSFGPASSAVDAHRSSGARAWRSLLLLDGDFESTPEHMHFAGFKVGRTPQVHMTYLMWKRGQSAFAIGTSRTYTNRYEPDDRPGLRFE